jgi:hypothetical protein
MKTGSVTSGTGWSGLSNPAWSMSPRQRTISSDPGQMRNVVAVQVLNAEFQHAVGLFSGGVVDLRAARQKLLMEFAIASSTQK